MKNLIIAVSVLTSFACERISSDAVKLNGVHAGLSAVSTRAGTSELTATYRLGGVLSNQFVELQSGDTLTLKGGTESKNGKKLSLLGMVSYSAEFASSDEDFPFEVALTLADGQSAPSSKVTLPKPFELTAPADGADLSRAAGVTVTWNNTSADNLMIEVSGDCIQAFSKSIPSDAGSFLIDPGGLKKAVKDGTTVPDTCAGKLTLTRTRSGTLDPAYGSGSISATQKRVLSIQLKP